jgi:hypothetical protein
MTLEEFKSTLKEANPPESLSNLLEALWYDAQGDWQSAHQLAQNDQTDNGAWVHAYLHKKEGDNSTAQYWYDRAGRKNEEVTFSVEWELIATELTKKI